MPCWRTAAAVLRAGVFGPPPNPERASALARCKNRDTGAVWRRIKGLLRSDGRHCGES